MSIAIASITLDRMDKEREEREKSRIDQIKTMMVDTEKKSVLLVQEDGLGSMMIPFFTLATCPAWHTIPTEDQIQEAKDTAQSVVGVAAAESIGRLWESGSFYITQEGGNSQFMTEIPMDRETFVLVKKFGPIEWLDDLTMKLEIVFGVAHVPKGYKVSDTVPVTEILDPWFSFALKEI